jgi:hypothetical protein
MRKLTLILTTLIFSVMFSSTSFAGWTKVNEGVDGDVIESDGFGDGVFTGDHWIKFFKV